MVEDHGTRDYDLRKEIKTIKTLVLFSVISVIPIVKSLTILQDKAVTIKSQLKSHIVQDSYKQVNLF